MTQQTLRDESVIAATDDGTQLVVSETLPTTSGSETGDRVFETGLQEMDQVPAAVRYVDPGSDRREEVTFEKFVDARVAFGLWQRCGPYDRETDGAVPREIATDVQDTVTAHIYLDGGEPLARSNVADICGISEQTVSDRLTRVRWTPE